MLEQHNNDEFNIEQFIISLKSCTQKKNPITIRELLKLQKLINKIRKKLSIEALSNIDDIDVYGFQDSDASG